MFNDSTFRFHSLFPSLRLVERSLPVVNGLEMLGYEALILDAIHSAIIMSQPFSGGNQRIGTKNWYGPAATCRGHCENFKRDRATSDVSHNFFS